MDKVLKGKKELMHVKFIRLGDLQKDNTSIIIIDMARGFYDICPLSSSRVENIISPLVYLNEKALSFKKVFFIDCHEEGSKEFTAYPPHCIEGTIESELIEELKGYTKNNKIIKKDSTNRFHTEEFQQWLKENPEINNFIVTSVCTDICVETFVISLVTYFNEIKWCKRS